MSTHPRSCLCAACLAATVVAPLPWEAAYDPTDVLHAELNRTLAPHGVIARVSSLGPKSRQTVCVDPADCAHAEDWPTGIGTSALASLEALADALERREARASRRARAPIARTLADAFPRGITLDAAQVDVLVGELDATLRRAGGAR